MSVDAAGMAAAIAGSWFHDNLMLRDAGGSLVATVAFAAVLYAPGYLLAYACDVFGFRRMPFAQRSLWATACSFVVSPIFAYFLGRAAGLSAIRWALAACTLATAMLLWKDRAALAWTRRERVLAAIVAAGWTAFVLLMLVDFQHGERLYFSTVMADQSYRIAFTDAVVRGGVPPANPLYFAGAAAPMRYYYFWYVLCATVVKLAHVSARQAFIASSVWAGFGLIATTVLFTRHFFRWEKRARWTALALLAVTGADLVPALGNAVLQSSVNGDIEWWSVDPIDAWPDSLLWVPHHVASVVCCLLAFLFLWNSRGKLSRARQISTVALAALACASAVGLSVYVAAGFAVMMLCWLLWRTMKRDPQCAALWRTSITTCALSAVLLIPTLHELTQGARAAVSGAGAAANPHLFILSVRRMIDSGLLTGLPVFATWNAAHPVLLDQTIRLLLLIPGLAMELGVYGAMLVLLVRAWRRGGTITEDPARETALFFTLAGLVLTMFLSSSVITNNDFGYRAVMLPQFFLWLLTAEVLASWHSRDKQPLIPATTGSRRLVYALLVLGIAGTAYGGILLRGWLPFEATRLEDGFQQTPSDEYAVRQVFADLDRLAPKDAVVDFGGINEDADRKGDEVMTPSEFYQRMLVMDTGRQMLNAELKCATHFGGDAGMCAAIRTANAALYAKPAPDAAAARAFCAHFGVHYLLLSHRDADWQSSTGWPVELPAAAERPGFRVLDCRSEGKP